MERAERVLRETLAEHADQTPEVRHSLVPAEEPERARRTWTARLLVPAMAGAAVTAAVVVVPTLDDNETSSSVSAGDAPVAKSSTSGDSQADSSMATPSQAAPGEHGDGSSPMTVVGSQAGVSIAIAGDRASSTRHVRANLVVRGRCVFSGTRLVVFPAGTVVVRGRDLAVRLPGRDVWRPGKTVAGGAQFSTTDLVQGTAVPQQCVRDASGLVWLGSDAQVID